MAVRLNLDERRELIAAAKRGRPDRKLSEWARETLLAHARATMREAT
jgi:hypothetical protein